MWWASATACESVSPDPKIFFVVVMFRAAPNKLLALSREREKELNLF